MLIPTTVKSPDWPEQKEKGDLFPTKTIASSVLGVVNQESSSK